MIPIKIGIIGGTGLNDPQLLKEKSETVVSTPYGPPSSALTTGEIFGVPVVLLARHGLQHDTNPSQINYRANVWALKDAGCTHVLATHACGSLREEYKIGDLIVLDQFIDRTFLRSNTFYSGQLCDPKGVAHIPMGVPFCWKTRQVLIEAAKSRGFDTHESGTIVIIEGPRFSTRAESKMFRLWGGDLVGMTTVPEVCLAKEAGMSYSSLAMVTDYDAWKSDVPHVTVEKVGETIRQNADKAKEVLLAAVQIMAKRNWDDVINENRVIAASAIM